MAAKMFAVALCVVAALGGVNTQADKYPAGVSPHLCPNYPHCDNVLLGAHAAASAGHGYAASAYGGYGAPAYGGYGHGVVVPVAKGYPAGVDPHTCPNYPYCGPTPAYVPSKIWAAPSHYAYAAPVHNYWAGPAAAYGGAYGKGGDRYPAGVDPHSCPNYPYCH